MLLHDVSRFAQQYDATEAGGVHRAVEEWNRSAHDPFLLINGSIDQGGPVADVYRDGCGLGMLQKRAAGVE